MRIGDGTGLAFVSVADLLIIVLTFSILIPMRTVACLLLISSLNYISLPPSPHDKE